MRDIEDHISPFIESQFPGFFKEQGGDFIAFVKAYYEWMETTGQATDLARNLFEYRDIDKTIDDFIVYFKQKYLRDLPYNTSTNKRLLVKHIQDLYRTKGTERGAELLFRLLYNADANVYYPGEDVLKPSDGEWKVPEYIELSPSTNNKALVGQTVVGTATGATAFAERIVRKRIAGKFIDVLFISARSGNFAYAERVVIQKNPVVEGAPKVIGSLTDLVVTNGGQDFQLGDVLRLNSGSGQQGKAIVTGISTETGLVTFTIENGGFGYTTDADVVISARNLTIANTTNANTLISGFERFETIVQPLGTIEYTTSNTAAFTAGTIIENYDGGGAVSANAVVVLNEPTTNTEGTMVVVPITGSINSDATFSKSGNSVTAIITTFANSTATGNVMFVSNTSLGVHNVTNQFVAYPGNFIRGLASNTYANVMVRSSGSSAQFSIGGITNEESVLVFSDLISANNTGNVAFTSVLLDGSNSNVASNAYGFVKYPQGDINTTLQNILRYGFKTIGEITVLTGINPGEGYNADPYVVVIEPEVAALNKRDYTLKLGGISGLFVTDEIVEASSNSIGQQLSLTGFSGIAANGDATSAPEIGEYVWQSNGTSNTASGFVYQTAMVGGGGTIRLNNTTGTFTNSYTLQTLTTNASATVLSSNNVTLVTTTIGQVKSSNSSAVKVKRLSLNNDFIVGDMLLGRLSGAEATITDVSEDVGFLPIGENAVVSANVQTANTVVSTLQVIDSGFGYVNDETVTMSLEGGTTDVTAKAILNRQGQSEGYYKSEKGFLSSSEKLFDGDYYQDYSYEIQSRIPLNKYAAVLKDVIHTAGTKFFGKVIFDSAPENGGLGTTVPDFDRYSDLHVVDGNGLYQVGEVVSQDSANGTFVGWTGTIVIANGAPLIEQNTQMSNPSFISNTSSANVVLVTSNTTHSILYINQIDGTIDTGDDFEAVIGRTLNINNVQQGNTVTGSFAVGEVVYQANTRLGNRTANGIVSTANSTHVNIIEVRGTWNSNAIAYGATSNAFVNTASVDILSNTYTSITSINTLHILNNVGQFRISSTITGANSGATSNVASISITLDT